MTNDDDDVDDASVALIASSTSNDDAVPKPFQKANEKKKSASSAVAANIALARQQTWKQIVTYKSTYCIGFCANCLVVFIVLLLSSAIAQFPVIYLRVAELRAGELDIVRSRTDNLSF